MHKRLQINLFRLRPHLLLDSIPGASCAYGLRKLRSAYGGPCLRVRRSSDNAEQDIGFAGLFLDLASLDAFVGANSGFVASWYDQSAWGRTISQATGSSQPTLVSSGTLVTLNSVPALSFGGTHTLLASHHIFDNNVTLAHVCSFADNTARRTPVDIGANASNKWFTPEQNTFSGTGFYGFLASGDAFKTDIATSAGGKVHIVRADAASGNDIIANTNYVIGGAAATFTKTSGGGGTYLDYTPNNGLTVGNINGSSFSPFSGNLTNVLAWPRRLSRSEVNRIGREALRYNSVAWTDL